MSIPTRRRNPLFPYGRNDIISLLLSLALLVPGCATVDQRVDVLYQPAANAKGGSGDLYLVRNIPAASREASGIQWILGGIMNGDGEKGGNVVTNIAPADLVVDALSQELKASGYNVMRTDSLPASPGKAVALNSVTLTLDETRSFLKDEARCAARISVQPWRDGKAVSSLEYEARYSDTAVTDRDLLLPNTLQKTLELLMARSVPEIVRMLESK